MKHFCSIAAIVVLAGAASPAGAQDFLDRVDEALTFTGLNTNVRARVSGSLDMEGYSFSGPAPRLILTTSAALLNPRLSLFVDALLGPAFYVFSQSLVYIG